MIWEIHRTNFQFHSIRRKIACVAGGRKGKGEGKIGRARNLLRTPNFPLSLSLSSACHAGKEKEDFTAAPQFGVNEKRGIRRRFSLHPWGIYQLFPKNTNVRREEDVHSWN